MKWLLLIACSWPFFLVAQDADLPIDDALLHGFDRLTIQTGIPVWSFIRPFPRQTLDSLWQSLDSLLKPYKVASWYRSLETLYRDKSFQESSSSHKIFANKRDFFSYIGSKTEVYVNPLLQFGVGVEQFENRNAEPDRQVLIANVRGANLRIKLHNKLGLYAEVTENQWLYPEHLRDLTIQRNVPPGGGFNKLYRERGYDFLNAKAYFTYSPISILQIKLGRDRLFYGNGLQSLLLSDWATDAYALQADWKFWKLYYHQRFAQLIDLISSKSDIAGDYPRKYGVWHQLSIRPLRWMELAVFESVIYASQLPSGRRGFEWQYFNPLIFYRAVEQAVGSPDNGLLGFQYRVDLWRRFRLYGQLIIDDFNFRLFRNNRGWWGNKYGWQLGFKYIDVFGLPGVDFIIEYNRIRPYLYSHFNTAASYSHFGHPLAHPYGANLAELVGQVRWLISSHLSLILEGTLLRQGIDEINRNYGSDIFRTNLSRSNGQANPDFNNRTLQGDLRNVARISTTFSWQMANWPAWLDFGLGWRVEKSNSLRLDWRPRNDLFLIAQFRWMIPQRRSLY